MPTLKQTFGAGPHTERGTAGKIDVSQDGKGILTCSGKTVIIRDARQLTKVDSYTEHLKHVLVARYSPSGSYVASGDEGGLIRVWSPDHPEKMLKKETPVLGGPIVDLGWDHESKRIIAGGNGGKGFHVKAFMFDTGSALGEMTGHQKPVTCIAVRPNKPSSCVSGSQDFKVGFYQGPPYKFVKSLVEHTNFVQGVAYSWDGNLICSVGSDAGIHIFDAESGNSKVDLPGEKEHSGSIYGCAFSQDGKQLVTVGGDKTCKLWDVEKATVITSVTVGSSTEDMQVAVAWSRSGEIGPVSVSLGGDLNVLDFASGGIHSRVKTHMGEPFAVGCDFSTKDVYVGDAYGGVTRYDEKANGEHVSGKGHTEKCNYVVARKGKVFTSGFDDTVKGIEGTTFKHSVSLGGQPKYIQSALEKPEYVAFVTAKKIGIIKEGSMVGSLDVNFEAQGIAISPKLDYLVVGEKAKVCQARVFAVSPDFKITPTDKVLPELLAAPICMSFSHDGKYLAIGDALKEVSLWDGATFAPIVRQKWVFHTSSVTSLAWSPDSQFIVSGSIDSHAYIWNPANIMKKTKISFAHKTGVNGVDWVGPNSVVTCGADHCVRIWDVELPV